jgi:hypothetical protein
MAPIRTPEGFVHIANGPDVAVLLLEAADRAEVDQKQIRTVWAGFHVPQEVADEFEALLDELEEAAAAAAEAADAEAAGDNDDDPDAGNGDDQGNGDPDVIVSTSNTGEPVVITGEILEPGEVVTPAVVENADGSKPETDENGVPILTDQSGTPVDLGDDAPADDEPEPLGVTEENSHDEIDDYASKLDPPVKVSGNKAEKIAQLEAARTANTQKED